MSEQKPMEHLFDRENQFQRWWKNKDFLQRRMIRFCLSMLVMVICFPLYYMGLFGSVDGPLHPSRIGSQLAGLGMTRVHVTMVFLSILIIAVCWNWIFNIVSWVLGSRLTCTRQNTGRRTCGALVHRTRETEPDGGKRFVYKCTQGHRRFDAQFHPVQKGTLSHCLWLVSLAFCLITIFTS